MLRNIGLMRRRPPAFLAQCADRYGPVVRFPMPRSEVWLVSDPDDVRRVLQGNHKAYGKRTIQYDTLALVTGTGPAGVGRRPVASDATGDVAGIPPRPGRRDGDVRARGVHGVGRTDVRPGRDRARPGCRHARAHPGDRGGDPAGRQPRRTRRSARRRGDDRAARRGGQSAAAAADPGVVADAGQPPAAGVDGGAGRRGRGRDRCPQEGRARHRHALAADHCHGRGRRDRKPRCATRWSP